MPWDYNSLKDEILHKKCYHNYSQGRRLLCRLAEEELMLLQNQEEHSRAVCVSRVRGCRWSSPSFSPLLKLLRRDWCGTPSPLPSFPSVDSEWNKNKFVASWSQAADQWKGEGRSWENGSTGLKRGKEGFYVTEWKIPRITRHMLLLFLSLYAHSLILTTSLLSSAPCLPSWLELQTSSHLFHFQGQVMPRSGTISENIHTIVLLKYTHEACCLVIQEIILMVFSVFFSDRIL